MKTFKTFKTLLTALSGIFWLARAGVVHLDITNNGDVTVDIDPSKQDLGSQDPVPETRSGEYDVELPYETHRGFLSDDSSYLKFSNIPFAEPPLGSLRFKAPIPPQKKGSDLNEGLKERVCPQYQAGWVPKAFDFLNCFAGALSETCSFKNNWTDPLGPQDYEVFPGGGFVENCEGSPLPLSTSANTVQPTKIAYCLTYSSPNQYGAIEKKAEVPVVVWIFGGGYIYGWKSQAGGPEPLLRAAKEQNKDIIYVAMNYRLGAFGWLSGERFTDEGGTPNAGLQDQRLALSWVQDFIGLFGGDKSSVTVMGQSAGGSSILHHIVAGAGAQEYKSNFSRAILQSPAFFPDGETLSTDGVYDELLARLGERDNGLEGLQRKSTFDLQLINAIMTYYSSYGLFRFGPKVDHSYVPRLPGQLLLNNTFHKGIPMILGHTSLDGLLFTPPWIRNDDSLADYIRDLYPDITDSVLETMKKDTYYGIPEGTKEISKITAVSDLLDDVAVSCNNHYLTNAMLKNDSATPVWRYLFGAKPAVHGSDVFFTYYPTKEPPAFVIPKMAQFMQKKYVNFILNGNPNGDEDLTWPKYDKNRRIMKFGDLLGIGLLGNISSIGVDPLKQYRCDLWQDAPFRYSDEGYARKSKAHGSNDPMQRVLASSFLPQGATYDEI